MKLLRPGWPRASLNTYSKAFHRAARRCIHGLSVAAGILPAVGPGHLARRNRGNMVTRHFHSRLFGCRAVGGIALSSERRFFFIQSGEHLRDIECFRENRWFFRERGEPLSIERPDFYSRRTRSERLPEHLVLEYVSAVTGVSLPLHFETTPPRLIALERSWHQLRQQPEELNVTNDLRIYEVP